MLGSSTRRAQRRLNTALGLATNAPAIMKNIILIALLIAASFYGYAKYKGMHLPGESTVIANATVAQFPELPEASSSPTQFKCDGRTHCSQMTSCAEATHFINHCPNTQMDGDNDGQPCESQWCN